MALALLNLDTRTRQLMREELDYDVTRNQLHISPALSGQGQRDYPNLLSEAMAVGNEETLAAQLRDRRRLSRTQARRRPQGGYLLASVPSTAANTLAESEFNRYYIRAICRRALEDNIPFVIVYRAKRVRNPRPESVELIESTLAPEKLLEDLRAHPGETTELNVPGGPNSGISVRLP